MMNKYDVIVVGGGIGGSSCAFYCKKAGLKTLMVEKEYFPRDKVCGDGLQAPMMPIIEEMGILDDVVEKCYINNSVIWYAGDEMSTVMEFNPPETLHYSCPRFIYDNIINKAAVASGIDYMEGFEALELLTRRNKAVGVRGLYNGKLIDLHADLIILASGSHSMLARQAGFYEEDPDYVFYGVRGYFDNVETVTDAEEFHYIPGFLDGSYIWLFPEADLENGTKRCNVGVFVTETTLKNMDMTSEEILYYWRDNYKCGKERLGNATLVGEMKGWRLPTGKRKPLHGAGVLAVGDSGNMIDQCWGGGAGAAMVSGKIAASIASAAKAAGDYSEEFLSKYTETINALLGDFYMSAQYAKDYQFKDYDTVKKFVTFCNEHNYGFGAQLPYLKSIGIETSIKTAYSK